MEETKNVQAQNAAEEILTKEDYKRIVENLLFITDRPLSIAKLSQVAQINNIQLTKDIVNSLAQEDAQTARAIQIIELGGGFQMSTKPEYGRWVRALFNEKTSDKLSSAALETLAIIAYKQPVTRAEIEKIRGVACDHAVNKLVEYNLVCELGRLDAPGRPLLFGTTEEFLRSFGVHSVDELTVLSPVQLEEFKQEAEEEMRVKMDI